MIEETIVSGVETETDVMSGGVSIGTFWAAIRGSYALAALPMRAPNDVMFEKYRDTAQQALSLLGGDVKSGELFAFQGKRYFVVRLNHANRSKTPRAPKVYELKEFV